MQAGVSVIDSVNAFKSNRFILTVGLSLQSSKPMMIERMLKLKPKLNVMISFVLCFSALNAWGGRIASSCVLAENSTEVTGYNVDKKMPLASVSKLITSLWATTVKGSEYRYTTLFYVTPVGSDTFDVHLKGSLDPYFSEQSLHYLISRLNQINVFKIRNLTFDENFKFYFNVNGPQRIPSVRGNVNPVDSQHRVDEPSPEWVKLMLSNKKQWLLNYKRTFARYSKDMVPNPKLSVQKIDFVPSSRFTTKDKPTGYIRSAEMYNQLKMMNWNSNNHAANTIFQSLGGKEKFDQFVYKTLKLTPNDIEFVNGSGNNNNFEDGPGIYNQATCAVIVRSVKALKKSLESQKHKLEEAVAVVGADHGATVERYGKNVGIIDGVVAKTGTVQPNVALAGMINTAKGNYFFSINVATAGVGKMKKPSHAKVAAAIRNEWSRSRDQIGVELKRIIKSLGGATSISYKSRNYQLMSFEDGEGSELSEKELDKLMKDAAQ